MFIYVIVNTVNQKCYIGHSAETKAKISATKRAQARFQAVGELRNPIVN